MYKTLLITLLLALLSISSAFAKEPIRTVVGIVTKISDGDSVSIHDDLGTKLKIRLYGIDAPETEKSSRRTGQVSKEGQPYGEESYWALQGKLERQRIRVDILDIDKYKRMVGIIWLNDRNINREMVQEGHAWAYRKYLKTPYASEFIGLEEQARSERKGLWKDNNPTPPWEFRKTLSDRKDL